MQTKYTEESSTPTFSVIMPCYNSQSYVRGALESILKQTWIHWELVAVNDGSTDDTLQILQEYAANDPRIKVYSKVNGGYVSAVNYGLEYITGDYFLMMGSDDALATDLFENLVTAMQGKKPDCIAFRTEIIQDGVNLGTESITNFSAEVVQFDTNLSEFAMTYPQQAEIFFTRDTSKCYRRSLLGDLRYFGRYGYDADGIFSMLLCHNATSFQITMVTGYYWTLRGDSLSGRKSSFAQDCDRIAIWTQFYQILLKRQFSLANAEKQYLYYLLDLLRTVSRESTREQKQLIRNAGIVIQEISSRECFELDLSKKDKLLLKCPKIWKLVDRYI